MKIMVFLKFALTILLSYVSVLVQAQFPYMAQWIFIYLMVFLVSWFGGLVHGMLCTVVALSLGGFLLIPVDQFHLNDLFQLLVLACLGFWISFSMHEYKKSRIKISASDELEKSLGFLDTLLENLPLMVFVKDAEELRFVKFNRAGLDLLGFSLHDLMGKNDFDLFPKDQAEHFTAKDREVLRGAGIVDIPREVINTKHHGQRILHTKKIPIVDSFGKTLYLLGVSEDITDRVEAEAKVERLRMQERETFVANAISSLSTTLDYQETLNRLVTSVVPAIGDWATLAIRNETGEYVRVAGLHADAKLDPLLKDFMESYPPSPKDKELILALEKGEATLAKNLDAALIESRSIDQRKVEIYRGLGAQSSMVVPIKFRGNVLGALSVVRGNKRTPFNELDLILVEEIGRRAGAVLENSLLFRSTQKAVRARDEFLSIASHELKTPITSLKMQLQMLERKKESELIIKPIKNSIKQVDRLTLLVNDLLDVSKFESGRMSYNFNKFSLSQMVKEVVENLRNTAGSAAEISLQVEKEIEIMGDHYRLEQVVVNLLNNALKYGDDKPVLISLSENQGEVLISVKDQGKGVPLEFQKKIFDKFERGRQDSNISGLGLGLFISKEIVLAHEGRIEVESSSANGSSFNVYLKLS